MYKFLGSKLFFQVSAFALLIGSAWFIYFTFIDKTNNQDLRLGDIYSLQEEIAKNTHLNEENRQKLTDLTTEINKLKITVCTLQKQIISLGAVPDVAPDGSCIVD